MLKAIGCILPILLLLTLVRGSYSLPIPGHDPASRRRCVQANCRLSAAPSTNNGPGLETIIDRKDFFFHGSRTMALLVGGGITATTLAPTEASFAKSYSANARNFDRMNAGDMSGGSTYDNNPSTEAGRKRRAMTGCKSPVARQEAAALQQAELLEKACNQRVLGGETEFMLQALRTLDCPVCPYGIKTTR